MNLLDKINQKNQVSAEEQAVAEEEAAIEASRPSPDAQLQQDRAGLSRAFSSLPEHDPDEEEPTPEEQQLFSEMESQVINILNEPRSGDAMLKSILNAPDALEAIAGVTADIAGMLRHRYPDADSEVIFYVGESALEQVVQLVETADPQVDLSQDEMAEAMSQAMNQYMKSHPQEVDEDTQDFLNGPSPDVNLGNYQ